MAAFSFATITAAQASAYSAASDSLSFGVGGANFVTVAYLSNPELVAITLNGLTVTFGPGIYGDDDLRFDNGGRILIGGPTADVIGGGQASDGIFGGGGADSLAGAEGDDVLQGNQGADTLVGGVGNDSIFGGQDNDLIILGTGAEEANWANGNRGSDTIIGSAGSDTLLGGQDGDLIDGGGGFGGDFLNGNLGDDTIRGGGGGDTILGDTGYDRMSGGGGADLFIFALGASEMSEARSDRILDWSADDRMNLGVKTGYREMVVTPNTAPPFNPSTIDPGNYYGPGTVYDAYGVAYPNAEAAARGQVFLTAEIAADSAMHTNLSLRIVATQINGDVIVFVDSDGDSHAETAIVLVGTTLASIDAANFV